MSAKAIFIGVIQIDFTAEHLYKYWIALDCTDANKVITDVCKI